jgi:hypothetical protein
MISRFLSSNSNLNNSAAKIRFKSVFILAAIFVFAIFLLLPQTVLAAASASKQVAEKTYPSSYFSAKKIIQSAETIEVEAGESATFTVGFKNTGKATWQNTGKQFISVYTASPYYRNSAFADASWISALQPAKLKNDTVKQNEVGYVEFILKAPEKAGEYQETFVLAAENTRFLPGGTFTVKIKVKEKPSYQATKIIQSSQALILKRGETANFKIGFKNTGREIWKSRALVKSGVTAASNEYELFVDPSWIDFYIPVKIMDEVVTPGQIAFLDFKLKAPDVSGKYVLKLALQANDEEVLGGDFELPITVTDESMAPPTEPQFVAIMPEPKIRIGLFESEPMEQIQANGTFQLQDENGNVLMSFEANELVSLYPWANGVHHLKTNFGKTYTSSNYFRFVLKTATYFLIPTYRRPTPGRPSENDNMVRGELWYKYAPKKNKFYMINVLPLEDYLKGLAENANNNPIEFLKAQAVAARTYALYYILNGGKHPDKGFDLVPSQNDQVYRGYKSELRMPNFVQAVEETRGMVVTYDDKIVITPYFGHSDGRTRDWTEVWGGSFKPWLVSRPCPHDVGMKKYGHGVGMSQIDARGRALEGLGYADILPFYYTNTKLKKVYE